MCCSGYARDERPVSSKKRHLCVSKEEKLLGRLSHVSWDEGLGDEGRRGLGRIIGLQQKLFSVSDDFSFNLLFSTGFT